jgi:TolB-like protein/DNA-binding winged helix-turn-helix (wHTH) protein
LWDCGPEKWAGEISIESKSATHASIGADSPVMAISDRSPSAQVIRFGVFEVDVSRGELRKSGLRIRLQEQPFQVLVVLLSQPGEIVSREELRERIWPDGTFVCFDYALNTAIKKIRVALSDDASVPRYVETIPRRGYRFIGDIKPVAEAAVQTAHSGVLSFSKNDAQPRFGYRWLTASLIGLVLLVGMAAYFARRTAPPASLGGRRVTVVVLPFENLSGDPRQNPLCDGLTEEVITQLGRIDPPELGVAARSTVTAYEQGHKSAAEIGRDLRAEYVVEGSLRRNGRQVRVSARLIRTSDQNHIWATEFDRELDDSLAFQTAVAGAISREAQAALFGSALLRSR